MFQSVHTRGVTHLHPMILPLVPCPFQGVPHSQVGGTPVPECTPVSGRGYPSMGYSPPGQDEVPLARDEYPPPTHIMLGQVMPWTICLLQFPVGELSCLKNIFKVYVGCNIKNFLYGFTTYHKGWLADKMTPRINQMFTDFVSVDDCRCSLQIFQVIQIRVKNTVQVLHCPANGEIDTVLIFILSFVNAVVVSVSVFRTSVIQKLKSSLINELRKIIS